MPPLAPAPADTPADVLAAPPLARDGIATGAGTLALPALVAGLVLLRALALPRLGLFNDEAYYWDWSRHLAAGYFDHPPLVAFVIAASTRLLGDTLLAVHLPAFVLSLLTTAALLRLVLELFPGRASLAWASAAALNAAPLFGLGAVFTTPDAPLLLLWTWTLLLVWRAVHGRAWLWPLAGATTGLALLAKYGAVLLPVTVVAFLLATPHRRWLARPAPWLALLLAAAIFTPVVLWNADHGWASFRFQSVHRFDGAFRPWRTVPRFLAAQQSLTPLLWLACLAGLARSVRRARAGSAAHALLAASGAVTLGFYAVAALFTYVNPNWLAPAFLTLVVAGAEVMLGWRSRLARAAPLALAAAATLLFHVQAATYALPLPPRLDFATDLTGWPEVGERLRALARSMPEPDHVFVYTRRLQLSGLAAFHAGPALPVTRLGGRADAYDDWRPPDGWRGWDAVYLSDVDQAPWEPFRRCDAAGSLDVVRSGRLLRTFRFWTCRGFAGVGAGAPER